ncbi:hypothetical protein MMC26_006018 [Xylographa opegraphella]|nr:hypothetical protein [Xylographa opegraphella]
MHSFRCIGLDWEMPRMGREEVLKITPGEFASRFFIIRANRQQYTSGDERQILTQAFTNYLDVCLQGGILDPNHRYRRDILEKWKADPYWLIASRRSGAPTPSAPSAFRRYESTARLDPPQGPANINTRSIPDGPRGFRDSHSPRDEAMTFYVIPPRDFLPLKDVTLSTFYDRFCNTNPVARKLKPWDIILSAYRDYVCKYYGNDLGFVWDAYKATNLDIPHNIRWKHCVALEDEIKQLNFKRLRQPHAENMSDTLQKRVKVEPVSDPVEIRGFPSTISGSRKAPPPLSMPEDSSGHQGASQLYSPSTPHLRVDWIHEQRGTEENRRMVLPIDIAVKGIASKSQATNGCSAPNSHRSIESTGHVRQASPLDMKTALTGSACNDHVLQSPTFSTKAAAAQEQPENHQQKKLASCSDVVVRKAVDDSRFGHDLLQSLILREKGSAAVEQSILAEKKQTASPLREIDPSTLCSASPFTAEPTTASSLPTVLSKVSTTIKSTTVQASTDSMRSPVGAIEENLNSLPKPVTKHVTRLDAFLKGAAKEFEACDEAITPHSIRLEAFLQSSAAELENLRSAMNMEPAAPDPKSGSRKSVTTHVARLAAFLKEAVIEQGLDDKEEITSHSIGLEALLGSAVSELGALQSALAA